MKRTTISVLIGARPLPTAVSLHSHTLHSSETLRFIYQMARVVAAIRSALARAEATHRAKHSRTLDLNSAWWTPPLAPYQVRQREKRHIEQLDAAALVSLTDHDDMSAPLWLRAKEECRDIPISTEWTVPFGEAFFHIGIHNIPPANAREFAARMASVAKRTGSDKAGDILHDLDACCETLIVFNHPLWAETCIGAERHRKLASEFVDYHGAYLHAFEFVKEVRSDVSEVLITSQYLEPLTMRILQTIEEILAEQESYGHGWRLLTDRVFYLCDDGETRSPTTLFAERTPTAVTLFIAAIGICSRLRVGNALRFMLPSQEIVF